MTFRAMYDGRCSECGDTIAAGDLLDWTEDRLVVHADCVHGTLEQLRPTCSRCHLECSASGACGCDDQ